ncbi:hypothetical protein DFH09DRAFT_1153249 [Mycena vulgaris]|nr:hypothetical protein DFH09DRAFT_1153249 [Mycena vulgaris]
MDTQRVKRLVLLGLTLLAIPPLALSLSLSAPTTDVVVSTTVDCRWTATLSDPANFSLVMQFPDGSVEFGAHVRVKTVVRKNTTSGTVSNISSVHILGSHRLAAYADPFDDKSPPFSVSPTFQVVANTTATTSTSATKSGAPASTSASASASTSSSSYRSKSRRIILIIAVIVPCAVLFSGIVGAVLLLRRRRRKAARAPDLLVGHLFPSSPPDINTEPSPLEPYGARSGCAPIESYRLIKAERALQTPGTLRLEGDEAPPPPYVPV